MGVRSTTKPWQFARIRGGNAWGTGDGCSRAEVKARNGQQVPPDRKRMPFIRCHVCHHGSTSADCVIATVSFLPALRLVNTTFAVTCHWKAVSLVNRQQERKAYMHRLENL